MKLSRRLFLKRTALAGGALASASAVAPSFVALGTASVSEVVTFFDGQLWLDTSGASRAFSAPLNAHPSALSEAEAHCLYGRL